MKTTSTKPRGWSLPILQGALPIKADQVPAEIIAGLTLAALAIPEVMGYTKIAGMPVITGLYTMLIPTALFALFGSSRHLVVGADSATAAILAAGLVGIASVGSDQYVALAALLAFMAASFLILARVIGLGFLANFLSRTVLVGFLTGVGIEVALGQVSGMLGLKGGGHGTVEKVWADLQQLDAVNLYALAIAIAVLVVIVGSKLVSKKIPGALIAVIGAIVLSLIDHTRRGYRPKNALLVPDASGVLKPRPVTSGAQALPGLIIYRFTHGMYYANAQQLSEEVTGLADSAEPPLRWFCIDGSAVDDVDFSAAETMRSLFAILKDKGIRLVVAQLMDDVEDNSRYHFHQLFGKDAFFDTVDDVVDAYRSAVIDSRKIEAAVSLPPLTDRPSA
ncbi:SulP family inorganic anion transporter [Thiocapsa bogorovii]|uniref:SulP family inorganic anion transporter n=1 Tax=Thiocapsa bogorovii TaxID=521689 RepID=UPI001E300144|nr:SulP family inorganic anion transporter [Thiocapsa bogorovii]UHD17794.1 STAS domain-containing protein [Thiocapsa bogorovii]